MRSIPIITLIVSFVSFVALASRPAIAGPITNGPSSAPFTKLGVYQGVVSVVSNADNAALELGYLGRDIASTGDLYFRPSFTARANGAYFTRNGNSADFYLSGKLCLFKHVSNIIDLNSMSCSDGWPSGSGSGSSLWTIVADPVADPFTNAVNGNFLQPINTNYGVHIGSSLSPVTGGTALTLDGASYSYPLGVANLGSGAALQTQGQVNLNAYGYVNGLIYINGQEVWHRQGFFGGPAAHEGLGSGLDADIANGNNVTLEPATSCNDDDTKPRAACICFTIFRVGSSPNPSKHCAAFSNAF